ncbi:CorA family divalent cation transporter [Vreelandella olivaria]|uniref:CorA family divalent cation transporter n=1 Tax=Vreelandella olivaria TaxID=390919 RepID=UPI00201FA457|nr:CorA family divalent cation transporter [Halomonas olivaria]
MNKNTKKETIIVVLTFVFGILGFELAFYFGAESFGKFILFISISTVIIFVIIGNIKFWFGKKTHDKVKK